MKRLIALALVLALIVPVLAEEGDVKLSERAQAVRLAEGALLERYGITQPMLCYFARQTDKTDTGWRLTYTGVEVFRYVLGEYTVEVSGGAAEAAWSWDGTEPQGFATAPWGEKQLAEIAAYVRHFASYAPYYQMAEALKLAAKAEGVEMNIYDWLPYEDFESIDPVDLPLGMDAMLDLGQEDVVRLWGLTKDQAERLSGTELPPDYGRVDGRDCIIIYYHFGTNTADLEALEISNPEWLYLVGVYALALAVDDGTVMDLQYSADLLGNG